MTKTTSIVALPALLNGCEVLQSKKIEGGWAVIVEWKAGDNKSNTEYAVAAVAEHSVRRGYTSWEYGHYITGYDAAVQDFNNNF